MDFRATIEAEIGEVTEQAWNFAIEEFGNELEFKYTRMPDEAEQLNKLSTYITFYNERVATHG